MGGFETRPYPTRMDEINQPRRRSIRLKDYDYSSAGAYFVTICTWRKQCLFGEILEEKMHLNRLGDLTKSVWQDLPNHYDHVALDEYVVMPNHFHGIVRITRAGLKPAPTVTRGHGLPEIIRGFKTFSSRGINIIRQTPGIPVWQRNYYERVIRDEEELHRAREYIFNNPLKWDPGEDNPQKSKSGAP